MTARRHPFSPAPVCLLSFNLLMGVVTLLVSGVAVFGFHHASQLQEQVQRQTLNDMRGSMDLARDTANVATAAVRLSQVVGALEYKSEAERLLATQQALKHSLAQLAAAPLAQQEQALVANIIRRSNALQQSVAEMLERGQRRHLQQCAAEFRFTRIRVTCAISPILTIAAGKGDRSSPAGRDGPADRRRDPYRHAAVDRPAARPAARHLPTQAPIPRWRLFSPTSPGELAKLVPLSAQLEEKRPDDQLST